ncbi:secreted protein/lipoprotein [Streptomyces atroolivaceus]|uniref:secreted protein/lipoprotein n=1 Tax=Streptomyces atroolivaceus TaxID=66869 RepID=UPI0020248C35|nr:secreted protein/lipoprotein [Streptomyces atroolivaceus]
MVTARQKGTWAGVVSRCGAGMVVLLLAGCGGGSEDGEYDAKPAAGVSPRSSATASNTPDSPGTPTPSAPGVSVTAVKAEVLRVYGLMWAEKVKAYRAASAEGTDLKLYMTPDALRALEADLARMSKERTAMRGDLGHEPEVAALAVDTQPPTATVKDCVDGARWQTLDTTTGWRIPPPAGQPARYAATARMEQGAGGRWKVAEYTADRTRSC